MAHDEKIACFSDALAYYFYQGAEAGLAAASLKFNGCNSVSLKCGRRKTVHERNLDALFKSIN
jgi:hypothetical protein